MSLKRSIQPMTVVEPSPKPTPMCCCGRISRRKLLKILAWVLPLIFFLAFLPGIVINVHPKSPSAAGGQTDICKPDSYNILNYRYFAASHNSTNHDQHVYYANVSFSQSANSGDGGVLKPAPCHASDTTQHPSALDPDAAYDTFAVYDRSGIRVFAITLSDVNQAGNTFNMSLFWICSGKPYTFWTNVTISPYDCHDVDDGKMAGRLCKGPDEYTFTAEHETEG
ncbi:uncharacterized protein BDZ99DRAFT_527141 [Mytilinidion resinicola]|uniref:Uncharacterized protein n=1 Tax=Mytilinidion resinicola TaxID=574789 RepID=A0A6A6Y232_9PEZI|nr:uncharacterized protein BDZ99DRAFT_527141 [Mytilinidion resinicola]KAF2802699.1 hypothetical protein BDZ99DRAFT_527141 [Mytilinidion resinicola]